MSKLKELRIIKNKAADDVVIDIETKLGRRIRRDTLLRWEHGGRMPLDAALVLADYYGVEAREFLQTA